MTDERAAIRVPDDAAQRAPAPHRLPFASPRPYASFHDAYVNELRRVYREPAHYNAPRGNRSRELLGVQFQLADPVQRLPFLPSRRTNVVFDFAEALWYLAGRDDLEFIAHYAPSICGYSMDGRSLTGTAYGRRIFGGPGGHDQWAAVRRLLAEDPDTKRAVFQIFDAAELAVPGNIDVACTLGLQFLLRDGALHAVATMRANDAYRGMTSDLFSFTFLQEFLATELGVRVGGYAHCVGSLHVYAPDDRRVEAVLDDPAGRAPAPYRVPAMPAEDNWAALRTVLEVEEALRADRHRLGPDLSGLKLHHYWEQVLRLFDIHRRVTRGREVPHEVFAALDPVYRYLLKHRWRDRMPDLEAA